MSSLQAQDPPFLYDNAFMKCQNPRNVTKCFYMCRYSADTIRRYLTTDVLCLFQCSVTCERGTQKRFLRCAEKYASGKYRELPYKKCAHLLKPDLELERACTLLPCTRIPHYAATGPPRGSWFASPWSQVRSSKFSQARWVAFPALGADG